MKELDEVPLPLEALRTPMPLRDADFAAIRARVRSELASRKERRTFWLRFGFASAAFAAIVIALLSVRPTAEQAPSMASKPSPSPVAVTRGSSQSPPAVAHVASVEAPRVPVASSNRRETPRAVTRKRARAVPTVATVAAASRIEIHTADPDIRIIWIVAPTHPKEES